jgi:hypothetical protein
MITGTQMDCSSVGLIIGTKQRCGGVFVAMAIAISRPALTSGSSAVAEAAQSRAVATVATILLTVRTVILLDNSARNFGATAIPADIEMGLGRTVCRNFSYADAAFRFSP